MSLAFDCQVGNGFQLEKWANFFKLNSSYSRIKIYQQTTVNGHFKPDTF